VQDLTALLPPIISFFLWVALPVQHPQHAESGHDHDSDAKVRTKDLLGALYGRSCC